jgi:hypothetical protein
MKGLLGCGALLACALFCNAANASEGDFVVSQTISDGAPIHSLRLANRLLDGEVPGHTAASGDFPVINFMHPGDYSQSRFPETVPFPDNASDDRENFAMNITAQVIIPAAGVYSFGVNGEDGYRLTVGMHKLRTTTVHRSMTRIKAFKFAAPGDYDLDLSYYEHVGGAELELFASEGRFHRFGARRAKWELVGDVADGGLALVGPDDAPVVDSGDPPTVGGGDPPLGADPSGAGSLPEPTGTALLAVLTVAWVGRRVR